MPIPVRCPSCSKGLNVPEKYMGKKIKCPECQSSISVPAAGKKAAQKQRRPAAVASPAESDSDFLADINLDSTAAVDHSVQICPKCAAEIPEGEVVCGECGHNITTGMLDAKVAKQRARKGLDPAEFYKVAFKDSWAFLKENFDVAIKTICVWAIFGTLASIFSVILANCYRGPTIAFWTFLTGLATFAVGGWYWFLSENIVRLTMDKGDKLKRLNVDTFQTLSLGIKSVVWPFVMGLPVWIVVFGALFLSGTELYTPADPALLEPIFDKIEREEEREVTPEEQEEIQLQQSSFLANMSRMKDTPKIVIGATFVILYMLLPIAQIHLTRRYTYKASVLWELVKVVPKNFGPVAFWNLLALMLLGPIIGIFVLLELYGGGANIFTNDYTVQAGEAAGAWFYKLVHGDTDPNDSIFYMLYREIVKSVVCFIGISIIAALAAPPAVMLMRITGKFGQYNGRNLGLVGKTNYGDPAGFWVRYVAFAIDLFCFPFAFLVAAREKAQSALSGVVTFAFVASFVGFPPFLADMFYMVLPMFLFVNAWVYYAVLESSTSRASIGKENMRLVAETETGKQLNLATATSHFMMSAMMLPAFPLCGIDPEKRSLADRMSKCRVVWKGDD